MSEYCTLPCPYCGGRAHEERDEHHGAMCCLNCGAWWSFDWEAAELIPLPEEYILAERKTWRRQMGLVRDSLQRLWWSLTHKGRQ